MGDTEPTAEEQVIERYFDAFNRHDIDAVMACFHDTVTIVDPTGVRVEGIAAVRARYLAEFETMPDAVCELRTVTGHHGRGVAESVFRATLADGRRVRAVGTEVMELVEGRIAELRDYHQLQPDDL